MTTPRLSTVFDNASLRLRHSGNRLVRIDQSSNNLDLKHSRATVIQDRKGNWIANDAVGSQGILKTRPTKVKAPKAYGEFIDADGEGFGDKDERASAFRAGGAKGKTKAMDEEPTSRKRRRINQDLDFLSSWLTEDIDGESDFLPIPSSDLLKYIHHFASNYYTEKGQLLNLSREYRKERKARRLAKMTNSNPSREDVTQDPTKEQDIEPTTNRNNDKNPQPPRKGVSRTMNKRHRRDMYKIMDGTALMAIGLLLQEHVAHLVTPRIPEGWEESMELAAQEGPEATIPITNGQEFPSSTNPSVLGLEQSDEDDEAAGRQPEAQGIDHTLDSNEDEENMIS